MELLFLLTLLALVGALASAFGADTRPSEHEERSSGWSDADQGHHA